MKKWLLIIFTFSILYNSNTFADTHDNFRLLFRSDVDKALTIKLAYYHGSKIFLQDSVTLRSSDKLSYSGPCHEGIYLLIFPDLAIYEFMVNENREYSIRIVPENNSYTCSIRGDSISEAFESYNASMAKILKCIDSLKQKTSITEDNELQRDLKEKTRHYMDSLKSVKKYFAEYYKGTFLGNYVKSQLPVSIPNLTKQDDASVADTSSLYTKLHYYKDHYLDPIDWNDQRLVFTPVLDEKMKAYFELFVKAEPESQATAIDMFFHKTNHDEVNKFIAETLFKRFGQYKHRPIDEYAYLYLIKNYYLQGETGWINDDQTTILRNDFDQLWPTSLGHKAPEINLPDKEDKLISLYGIQSEYTIVFFWDYECNHCKRILQELVSLASKYKYMNLQVLTVFTGEDQDIWRAYLARKIPEWWINTYQTGQETKITNTYNVSIIPSIFLLDSDKSILHKNVTTSELDTYFFHIAKDKVFTND